MLKSLYIASTQGSGGKTTIAVGLCVALRRRGLVAGYFKPVGTLASEFGGVLLDVADSEGVRAGFATLLQRAGQHAPTARIEGVLVAKQIKGAVEMALGVFRDPVFGPVAMVGLGGIFIEVLKDVSFRRCAASRCWMARAAGRRPMSRLWRARSPPSRPSPLPPGRGWPAWISTRCWCCPRGRDASPPMR